MKKTKKIMALMPLATTLLPLTAFAETKYETSTEEVSYSDKITTDSNENVDVLVSQSSVFSVNIPKRIILDGASNNTNDANYNVTVTGNIASDEIVNVTPTNSFMMKDTKKVKADIVATVTQPIQKFVNEEAKNIKYNTQDNVNALDEESIGNVTVENLSAGSWTGTFNFLINLETVTFSD